MSRLLVVLFLFISVNVWAKSETKYYCDRCGKKQEHVMLVSYKSITKVSMLGMLYNDNIELELCESCLGKYTEIVDRFMSNHETEITLPPLPCEVLSKDETIEIVETCLGCKWHVPLNNETIECIESKFRKRGINIKFLLTQQYFFRGKSELINWLYENQTRIEK